MATLNLIADELSATLDRPFDSMLKERIKSSFRHAIYTLLRQQINKYGINDNYKTRFYSDLMLTEDITNSNNINLYRSKNKIPTPLRYNSDDPFTSVTILDSSNVNYSNNPFLFSKPIEIKYNGLLATNINKPPRYVYLNEYIYIFNINPNIDINTSKLIIEGVYPINDILSISDKYKFNDNTTLTVPEDLIEDTKAFILKYDFSITDARDKVKPINIDNE